MLSEAALAAGGGVQNVWGHFRESVELQKDGNGTVIFVIGFMPIA